MVGEHCTAKSSATSSSSRLQAETKLRKSSSVPNSGCTASWRLRRRQWRRGFRDRLQPRSPRCCGPCGWCGRWVNRVRYTTSKPIAAISGSRAMQSSKVPCWPVSGPGCAAPSRTCTGPCRGRSAIKGNNCDRVRSGRNWLSAIASFNSAVSSGARHRFAEILALPQDHRSRHVAPACALVSMPAPRSPRGSVRRRPSASARIRAAKLRIHRSRPRWRRHSARAGPGRTIRPAVIAVMVIGSRRHSWSCSRRQTSAAFTTSCPSRYISAQTSMRSPAMRFTGKRPPSISG